MTTNAAGAGDEDDDYVLLKCTDPDESVTESDCSEITISTSEICSWDLSEILSHQIITVKTHRHRLIQHSSYFRGLLCGSFSESRLNCVSVKWDLETLIIVLKFMFGVSVDIISNNFLPLFEGALFFGVEMLLLKCKIWLIEETMPKRLHSMNIQLDDLIHIWRFGAEHGIDFIPEHCTGYLARNFMRAICCKSFPRVPRMFLLSCIKHPDLTIESERHLADAIIHWITANAEQSESSGNTYADYDTYFKEICISLLPLWFVAGKRRCCYFSKVAEASITAILNLMSHPSTSMKNSPADHEAHHPKIRLSQYTKKIDLSGCPQIKSKNLLESMLPDPFSTETMLTASTKQLSLSTRQHDGYNFQHISIFEALEEVDISNCPGLCLEAAVNCFCKLFRSLRVLKAAHYLDFDHTNLGRLLLACPVLTEVDLTVDISPLVPSEVSKASSSSTIVSPPSIFSSSFGTFYMSAPVHPYLCKLILEGRVDVTDNDLNKISWFCPSLCYLNLRGCTSVTDAGFSNVILTCSKLHSLLVCGTSFGCNSISALMSDNHETKWPANSEIGEDNSMPRAFKLQELHVGGCKVIKICLPLLANTKHAMLDRLQSLSCCLQYISPYVAPSAQTLNQSRELLTTSRVDSTSLPKLLSQTPELISLCLREMQSVDEALCSFLGSSLEMLDVTDTKVSSAALAHIVFRNPELKCLRAKGCTNLFHQNSTAEYGHLTSLEYPYEWYMKLAKTCNLKEIALGWGFSSFSLEALRPAIATLREITVGLGATLGPVALEHLPTICPLLESVSLYFQVISDCAVINLIRSLRHLQVLALCHCLGDISPISFRFTMPNLRTLQLERVTPWMTNDDLVTLVQNCPNLIEIFLTGCRLLNSDSQTIISSGWPGLISIHLEDCGEVTVNGISSLFECKAVEDILLRHNGPGIQRNFILHASAVMPMLRKVSVDVCDSVEGDFDIPNFADRHHLSIVKIARCKHQRCGFGLENSCRGPVHKETLVMVWDSQTLNRAVVKER